MRGALFGSFVLSFTSAIFLLLILIAGTNKNILVDWFFIEADTSSLKVPARLSNSDFRKDLTTVSGIDFVGTEGNAQTLGLGSTYTVSLFSSCSESNKTIRCTPSKFGYVFDPLSELKLDNTALEGSFSSTWLGDISYKHASRFLGLAYIVSIILATATFASILINCILSRTLVISAILSMTTAISIFVASATSLAVFRKLRTRYNNELLSIGIKTSVGRRLTTASFAASSLLFLCSMLLFLQLRRATQAKAQKDKLKAQKQEAGVNQDSESHSFAPPKRTKTLQLLKQIPGLWKGHSYKQIGGKGVVVKEDRDGLVKRGFGGDEDSDDGEGQGRRGIPLVSVGVRPEDSSYEPYRNGQV